MGTSLWVALTAVSAAILVTKQWAGHSMLLWVLARFAALGFLAAGVIGAGGWIGRRMNDLVTWAMHEGQHVSMSALDTAVTVGVLVFLGSIVWLLALLPDRWWGGQMPDWGSVCGLFLPALAASIPGPAGRWLRDDIFPSLTAPLVDWVRSWFGM